MIKGSVCESIFFRDNNLLRNECKYVEADLLRVCLCKYFTNTRTHKIFMCSNEDEFYIKITDLGATYNFIVIVLLSEII